MVEICPNTQAARTLGQAGAGRLAGQARCSWSRHLSLFVLLAQLGSGCASYSTDSTEVGVRTRKLFGAGIEQQVYAPGATYFFMPFFSDWATFDVKLQNLDMFAAEKRGGRSGEDAIEFKTRDGNDIRVDVNVAWRIDPDMAPRLLARVGRSTEAIKEKLVRPVCRSYVRDLFNELDSERFYNSDQRLQKGSQAQDRLKRELGADGIIIEQVIIGQYYLNPDYQRVIHDRKIAEQAVERIKSESLAAAAEQSRNQESVKGDVQVQIAQARGEAQQIRIVADRNLYQKEREARAILAEAQGQAKGVEKQNQAMAGPGGRTAVKLRVAESLAGKPIIIVPPGSGARLQTLDINRILGSLVTKSSREWKEAPPRREAAAQRPQQ